MSALPSHFSSYRMATANQPTFSARKYCVLCKLARETAGGEMRLKPGSSKRGFVCAICVKGAA